MTPPVSAEGLRPAVLDSAARQLLARGCGTPAGYAFFQTRFEVLSDKPEAAHLFGRRYARAASQGTPDVRVHAARARERTFFWLEPGPAYVWDGRLESARQIEFLMDSVIRHEYFTNLSPFVAFHSAAVGLDDVAIAITAASEGGKTTTALACARRGMPLYSDEHCVVDDGRVLPFPRALNIRSGAVDLLSRGPEFADGGFRRRMQARRGERWEAALPADLMDDPPQPTPQPLHAIFFIVGRAAEPAVEPLAKTAALPLLMAANPLSRRRGLDRVALSLALLSGAPGYALTLGTPDATAIALRDFVRAGCREPVLGR